MASENVKIKINEVDKTSPAGSGIDSTDIAFIPGFSVLATAEKNNPTLCTSVREFETLFGKKPRVLTSLDVAGYESYGFMSGDYDRSYVYAKELLYQGMPVVYSNIVADSLYSDADVVDIDSVELKQFNTSPDPKDKLKISLDEASASITIKAVPELTDVFDGTVQVSFTNNIVVDAAKDNIPQKTSFEYLVATEELNEFNEVILKPVVDVAVDEDKIINATTNTTPNSSVEKFSDTQIEFVNKTSNEENVKVTVHFSIPVYLKADEEIVVVVKQVASSVLDAFYKADKDGELFINKQWEVGGENSIADKSVYSVKYITSGGYPSVVHKDAKGKSIFADKMLACAAHRGDAVALIDYQMKKDLKSFSTDPDSESFYACMHSVCSAPGISGYGEYGAAMYPWSTYTCTSLSFAESSEISMPASYAYLICLAKAIKTSPNWLAMAGVTRGIIPGINKLLTPYNVVSNTIAEEMQPKFGVENHNISVNSITNVRPYGLTLWGNRTLKPVSKDGTVALNFLNTRNMLSDIKKLLYTTAKSCMFEQNSDDLWLKFKDGIRPLLERLKAGNGISDYKIVRGTTKYNGDPLAKGEIAAVIKIYPMYAVEYFELSVEINDEEVTVD